MKLKNRNKIIIWISIIALVVVVSVLAVNFLMAFLVRQSYWDGFSASKLPCDYGTEWASEDGSIVISTDERYIFQQTMKDGRELTADGGYITKGNIFINNKNIAVYAETGWDSTFCVWLNDGPYSVSEERVYLEEWEVIDCEETETKIIFVMEVVNTTYFEVGQEIKLIYEKK